MGSPGVVAGARAAEDFKIAGTIGAALEKKLPISASASACRRSANISRRAHQLAAAHGRPSRVQVKGGRLMQSLPMKS